MRVIGGPGVTPAVNSLDSNQQIPVFSPSGLDLAVHHRPASEKRACFGQYPRVTRSSALCVYFPHRHRNLF